MWIFLTRHLLNSFWQPWPLSLWPKYRTDRTSLRVQFITNNSILKRKGKFIYFQVQNWVNWIVFFKVLWIPNHIPPHPPWFQGKILRGASEDGKLSTSARKWLQWIPGSKGLHRLTQEPLLHMRSGLAQHLYLYVLPKDIPVGETFGFCWPKHWAGIAKLLWAVSGRSFVCVNNHYVVLIETQETFNWTPHSPFQKWTFHNVYYVVAKLAQGDEICDGCSFSHLHWRLREETVKISLVLKRKAFGFCPWKTNSGIVMAALVTNN